MATNTYLHLTPWASIPLREFATSDEIKLLRLLLRDKTGFRCSRLAALVGFSEKRTQQVLHNLDERGLVRNFPAGTSYWRLSVRGRLVLNLLEVDNAYLASGRTVAM